MSRFVGKNVVIRYPGGAIYIARLKEATPTDLLMENPVWVASTGRFGKFFRGEYDSNCEWEVMGPLSEVPRAHAEISAWEHELPTSSRPA